MASDGVGELSPAAAPAAAAPLVWPTRSDGGCAGGGGGSSGGGSGSQLSHSFHMEERRRGKFEFNCVMAMEGLSSCLQVNCTPNMLCLSTL